MSEKKSTSFKLKRYNGSSRLNAISKNALIEVEITDVDEFLGKPAYAAPSVVDTTYFKPGVPDLMQAFGSTRTPLYDSGPDGKIPDMDISPAYLRSPARDRTEIDFAVKVLHRSIDEAKEKDSANIKEIEKSNKALESIKEVITQSIKDSSDISDSDSQSK